MKNANELVCYLIEPVNDTTTSYFDGVGLNPDVNLGLKFATKELCEMFINSLVHREKFKAVEHLWDFGSMKYELSENAAKNLIAYIGCEPNEAPLVTLKLRNGKLFVYMTEYPEDGSVELELEQA